MDQERDYVVFEDEDGNEIELDIVDQFPFEGREYAVLMDLFDLLGENSQLSPEAEGQQADMYVMEIVMEGEEERFIPVEDEALLDQLSDVIYQRINELEEEIEEDKLS